MSSVPTSALTFADLILEVALKLGVAYYGPDGTGAAQIPTNTHDLAMCKRLVNAGIRRFIADAPKPAGWRWTRPVASVALWPDVTEDDSLTVSFGSYDSAGDQTLVTANQTVFYESMEQKTITLHDGNTVVIKRYVSPTQVYVYGDHSSETDGQTFSIVSGGDFTLPRTFAGTYTGQITFGESTNRAVPIAWADESLIRRLRENVSENTGTPTYAAVALFQPPGVRRRQYQLRVYPKPDETYTVEFPFDLHFDSLTANDDPLPTPIAHDEAIRAACLAAAELEMDGAEGTATAYYRDTALPNSHAIDARSAPPRLGYFGNGAAPVHPRYARSLMIRPTVTYGP